MAISSIAVSRIAIGNREEFTRPGALNAALAEFFSTLIFVFAGQGASMAFSKLTVGMPLTPAGLVVAAVAHGFGLFAAVSVSFNISGGHVNPAVTFGVLLGGNISVIRAAMYWIAQLAGSTAACLLLRYATGGLHTGVFALSGINAGNALVLEIVMTFGLVYTVYATAVDPGRRDLGTIAPLCIGFVLAANIFAGGAFDGASMNPAVSFGPALVSWKWADQWVYWVGPLVGGGIAGVVYDLFFITHTHEPLPADVAY